jgi:hypothetical protein
MNDLASQPAQFTPSVIHRADYRPPAWLVPDIALDFVLDLTETRVSATLDVERNPAAKTRPPRCASMAMASWRAPCWSMANRTMPGRWRATIW